MLHYNILQDGPGLGVPGASRVMKWFRIRTRLGARLSLLAMALQLALTFGGAAPTLAPPIARDHAAAAFPATAAAPGASTAAFHPRGPPQV